MGGSVQVRGYIGTSKSTSTSGSGSANAFETREGKRQDKGDQPPGPRTPAVSAADSHVQSLRPYLCG